MNMQQYLASAKQHIWKIVIAGVVLVALIGGIIGGCEDDDEPVNRTRTTSRHQSYTPPAMSKDAAERVCAARHGVPKWYRPDRDYHNCVDRLT